MIVHKFGGTSVGDARCFANVADIVIEHYNANETTLGEKDSVYREIKAGLLSRHLEVVEALLTHNPQRHEVGGLVEDRLHDLERLYRSIAIRIGGCGSMKP